MKKYCYYAGMLAAGMIAFSSCSKDEEIINPNQPGAEDNTPEIVLQVANTGDGLTTKGGRPLTSSDAAQDIDKVSIYLVDPSTKTAVLSKDITDWMNESALYDTNGHGRQYTWKLSKTDVEKLTKETAYRVYAIGYTTAGSRYTYSPGLTDLGSTAFNFVNAQYAVKTDNKDFGEEIFAGEIASLTLNADKEFVLTEGDENVLTLHRQVTGTIGYFENIPTFPATKKTIVSDGTDYDNYVNGLKLRLVVSDLNDQVQMGCFNTAFTETNKDVQYVVNGVKSGDDVWTTSYSYNKVNIVNTTVAEFAAAGLTQDGSQQGYVVYEIKLSDWFKAADTNDDGYLSEEDAQGDNWVTPVGISDDVAYQRGTVFAGKFLVPVAKVPSTRTMQLQLVAETALNSDINAGAVVRAWNINLPDTDPQLKNGTQGRHVNILSATGEPLELGGGAAEYEEKTTSYSLVRNHLYTVGQIDNDTNEPEDLSKGLNLIVKVNDNWEMIHKMEVE